LKGKYYEISIGADFFAISICVEGRQNASSSYICGFYADSMFSFDFCACVDPSLVFFCNYKLECKKMRIYLDLDGVMADFDKHFKDTFDSEPNDWPDSQMWKMINSYETFYADLPLMPGALRLFEKLTDSFDVIILTACPRSNYTAAALQKKAWVREHLSDDITILPVMGGKNKSLFMHEAGDILIDDMEKNCKAWQDLGGIAIVHKSVDDTISQLIKIMEVTH
jgi:hypothetical protein